MKIIYFIHGVLTYVFFSIADFIDRAIILGQIAYDRNSFIDEIEPDEIDKDMEERL